MILKEFSDDVERFFNNKCHEQTPQEAICDLIECFEKLRVILLTESGHDTKVFKEFCGIYIGSVAAGLANVCNKLDFDFTEVVNNFWSSFKQGNYAYNYTDSEAEND